MVLNMHKTVRTFPSPPSGLEEADNAVFNDDDQMLGNVPFSVNGEVPGNSPFNVNGEVPGNVTFNVGGQFVGYTNNINANRYRYHNDETGIGTFRTVHKAACFLLFGIIMALLLSEYRGIGLGMVIFMAVLIICYWPLKKVNWKNCFRNCRRICCCRCCCLGNTEPFAPEEAMPQMTEMTPLLEAVNVESPTESAQLLEAVSVESPIESAQLVEVGNQETLTEEAPVVEPLNQEPRTEEAPVLQSLNQEPRTEEAPVLQSLNQEPRTEETPLPGPSSDV